MSKIIKQGIFYRVLLANGKYVSKKRFLRLFSAVRYMDMMDVHSVPVVEYKEREKNGKSQRSK